MLACLCLAGLVFRHTLPTMTSTPPVLDSKASMDENPWTCKPSVGVASKGSDAQYSVPSWAEKRIRLSHADILAARMR